MNYDKVDIDKSCNKKDYIFDLLGEKRYIENLYPTEIEKQFKNMKLVVFTILSFAVTASLANPLSDALSIRPAIVPGK